MTPNHCILVPGWATDGQIFQHMTLPFSSVEVVEYCGDETVDRIVAAVKAAVERLGEPVAILGFSMGGFLVVQSLPQIRELVSEVFLVGIRKQYSALDIEQVSANLSAGMKGFLRAFYSAVFPEDVFKLLWLHYATRWTLEGLQAALAHLGRLGISPESLIFPDRTVIVHGRHDLIAPLAEAVDLASNSGCKLRLLDAGHFVKTIITT